MRCDPQGFAKGEDTHCDDNDVDSVSELRGIPKVSRAWPLTESSPTRPMVSPSASEMKPRSRELPSTAVTAMKASSMDGEILRGTEGDPETG